jgi:hypothetical protein
MTIELGRLQPVPLRDVWAHEANDFTPWLALPENLALLAETLNLGEFSEVRTEVPVVNFYIDILAKDELDGSVLIENQFGPSDHKHLGQIMTYLAGQKGHVTVVWVAETFREEHRAAIDWLNSTTIDGFDFFAVEVEAWKIGASLPAPRFDIVAKPNSWSRSVTRATRGNGNGDYVAYWTAFVSFLNSQKLPFRVPDPPSSGNAMGFPFERSGFRLVVRAAMASNRLETELIFKNPSTSKLVFDALIKDRAAIDGEFGEKLEWSSLDDQIVSKVEINTTSFQLSDRHQWQEQHIWLLNKLQKFRTVFRDRILKLPLPEARQPKCPSGTISAFSSTGRSAAGSPNSIWWSNRLSTFSPNLAGSPAICLANSPTG